MSIIIITLNPSELLKQTRDTKRISNLKSINNALSIFQATKSTAYTGVVNTVYVSIPDSSSTCVNLGLPVLPGGYTYACSTSANHRKTDGTGWIPVNFDSLDIGSPLSSLPIDPTNTTSTGLYYVYVTGGSWELSAVMESVKFGPLGDEDKTSTDGGDLDSIYEIGTDFTLAPLRELVTPGSVPTPTPTPTPTPEPTPLVVAYWKFDDASGTTAIDSSGRGHDGTLVNGPTWKSSSECKSGGCLYFDGSNDLVTIPDSDDFNFEASDLTIDFWVKFAGLPSATYYICGQYQDASNYQYYRLRNDGSNHFDWHGSNVVAGVSCASGLQRPNPEVVINQWYHIAFVRTGNDWMIFQDGIQVGTTTTDTDSMAAVAASFFIGNLGDSPNNDFYGSLDEFRISTGVARWTENFTPPTEY